MSARNSSEVFVGLDVCEAFVDVHTLHAAGVARKLLLTLNHMLASSSFWESSFLQA